MDVYMKQFAAKVNRTIKTALQKDMVLSASLVLALTSCLFSKPKVDYIDFKVLASLFNLMIAVKAFEELHVLDRIAVSILNKCGNSRRVSLILILLSFFLSMAVTNDIALITLVPIALIIGQKSGTSMLLTVILQTLAANIGSSLTPMGNPQNLYLFSYYSLDAAQFFSVVSVFAALGLVWLLILNLKTEKTVVSVSIDEIAAGDTKKTVVWAAVFIFTVISVFGIVSYKSAFLITAATALILNKKLLLKADYSLLVTFVCFFIFIGNLSNIPAISEYMEQYLENGSTAYFGSILISQVISNVPCAILLSGFTGQWRELLLGVNIGGMGTIIASLASVISYKLYTREHPEQSRKYLGLFSIYNIISLLLFTLLCYIFLVL